ncbi:hypothetical protein QRO11_00320 [Paracidovorax citrulli]|uniref:hypothetical protein n=1 Tax=Paracidovorax citrulli TaxID=80869 RepID=UPI0005FBF805|nr:hypothetical protein [Paracidovorax citrulli]UMT90356.1 hypothetical protein FRC90_21350 [Paracidovorax citrulli]WIY34834.1 hypothetical protein QRO11_00320 [Paracidovorax citrulli]SDK21568.1 hypothetical protein SAMN04489709_1134 [Paracidovorax citrulli]
MPVDAAAVAKLQQACDKAAALYPNSCSHSVWYVIQQYLPNQPWMNANALMDHVQGQRHWRSVPASQVGALARGGALIVGGGWPGARSKGDKTIWDPWASDAKFAQVTFWQLVQ